MGAVKRIAGIVLLLAAVLAHAPVYAAQSREITDAKAYMIEVNEAMRGLKSYRSTFAVDVKSPIVNLAVTSSAEYLLKPELVYRNSSECVMTMAPGGQKKFDSVQYMRQSGNTLTAYTRTDMGVTRQTIPYDANRIPLDMKHYMKMMKSAKIKDQTDDEISIAVTIDGKVLGEMAEEMIARGGALPRGAENLSKLFREMGDFTYLAHVDKKTKYVVNIYMDLTELTRRALNLTIDGVEAKTDKQKRDLKNIRAVVNEMQVLIQGDMFDFDQVEPFDVPREIIDQGVENKAGASASSIGIIGGVDADKSREI